MKYVYFFGDGKAEEEEIAQAVEILGGKGAGLAKMAGLGLPVPQGFTISAEVCRYYYIHHSYPPELREEVEENLQRLEQVTGKGFGDVEDPLLVSVRSGAAVSMPGMMDTILNVGLNEQALQGLIRKTNNPRFAWDAYRRLLQMFGNVVKGIQHDKFDSVLERKRKEKGVKLDTELDATDLQEITQEFRRIYREHLGQDSPEDPQEQLWQAIEAVFKSWNNPRAIKYREIVGIPHDALGTAVNIQAMVFGNMGDNSCTGVAFTRNPATGEKEYYGEYLSNAQGEDVVAGLRTPKNIKELQQEMPQVYIELEQIFEKLEKYYRDIQDVEFTVQEGKLYMLQTRSGKRTAKAAVKVAVDMVHEGLITKEEALLRVEPAQLIQLLHPSFDPKAKKELIAKGLAASPGAAAGRVAFTADKAERWAEEGKEVILVRRETSPDDIHGMEVAKGILTARGGLTSHAAIVARGIGKPCVVGCEQVIIDYENKEFTVNSKTVKEGDYISIDGATGEVMLGHVPTVDSEIVQVLAGKMTPHDAPLYQYFIEFMAWADEIRRLGVRANADTPQDARLARNLGAEGIGLARTEHMFFGAERIPLIQGAIIAEDEEVRRIYLEKLAETQKGDFKELLRVMDGLPVIIRLLDPPLHEFLPHEESEINRLARDFGVDNAKLRARVESLKEFNPMLGHRGCRLGITTPDIYNMQVEAIIKAACELKAEGLNPKPQIMVPLVGHVAEMRLMRRGIEKAAKKAMEAAKIEIDYKIGTMIEVPRACITADEIATEAEFFSFGTNDLTQMAFGFSRDDAGKFLSAYYERGILDTDPFYTIDQSGVGELMKLAIEKGRRSRKGLSIGICGEHGGEERSVKFCHKLGLDYVSASPYRVPIARLAAAQAVLEEKKTKAPAIAEASRSLF